MITFLRKIRRTLIESGATRKYLLYAIGEILLVMIGILLALQVNNWNEQRKNKTKIDVNIQSIGEDIRADISKLQNVIESLNRQDESGKIIIPIMESEEKRIVDSLEFIIAFNRMADSEILERQAVTWDELKSSGMLSEFPDLTLIKMLQNYYTHFINEATNFKESAHPTRLEIRKLKYELFTDSDHRKFFFSRPPQIPSEKAYRALLEDKRVLPLCRYIRSSSTRFSRVFNRIRSKAEDIVIYVDKNYPESL